MKYFALIISVLTLSACTKVADLPSSTATNYFIKKGCHYFSPQCNDGVENDAALALAAIRVQGTHMERGFLFDQSAVYTTASPNDQADINKLFGFGDCSSLANPFGVDHHVDSARVGWDWSPIKNKIELWAYTYANSIRSSKFLGDIALNTIGYADIALKGSQYVFTYNGNTVTMNRGCSYTIYVGLQLLPYFGGSEDAPHDVTVKLY